MPDPNYNHPKFYSLAYLAFVHRDTQQAIVAISW